MQSRHNITTAQDGGFLRLNKRNTNRHVDARFRPGMIWITCDKGFIQEKDVINLMWPGMIQPVTLKPVIEKINTRKNEVVLQIKCNTPGESIAYRFEY